MRNGEMASPALSSHGLPIEAELTQRSLLDELNDLYHRAPCGYHSLDLHGVIIAINDTYLQWLGYQREEVLGRLSFGDLLTPASRAAFVENLQRFKAEGAAHNLEYEMVRRDGSIFPVLVNATAVRDAQGAIRASRATVIDITQRKRAEAQIRQLNEELEQRVRERTAELAEANRDLAHKSQENEMFVYSVSHDLRSPLVNLQGFSKELELLARELRGLVDSPELPAPLRQRAGRLIDTDMAECLRFIQTAVLRLGSIIDALLRLSRAGRVVYQPQWVGMAELVQRVVDALQVTLSERGATVLMKKDLPPAWGDRTALEQVFANLVGNALNYLDPHRPGIIEVGCVPAPAGADEGAHQTYYVRDNGLGIPEAHKAKVFQAFQRLHPGAAPGEGMGLMIVHRIVQRHRGKVWFESKAGVGTTFYVSLPPPLAA